jgi:hypothetical protein
MFAWISIAAVIAVAFLGWNLFRRFGSDRIAELNEQRRTTSKIVSRGEFVDGNRHLDVAIAVTATTFFYENAGMQASIDLQWVREIEYDTALVTGVPVESGRVLRLRTDSQVFEFVIPNDVVSRWYLMLPPRAMKRAVVVPPVVVVPQVASAT